MNAHALPDAAISTPLVTPTGDLKKSTVYLKNVIDHPNFDIGDWSYYTDQSMPENYGSTLAPFLRPGESTRAMIGSICQIAQGLQIVTTLANHPMKSMSTYPFAMFDGRWGNYATQVPAPKEVVIGNDCWIGREAIIMPGAVLGNGFIVGTRAVVTRTISDYAIVAGNPAQVKRTRFDDETIERLKAVAWWDWDQEKIERAIPALKAGDLHALEILK